MDATSLLIGTMDGYWNRLRRGTDLVAVRSPSQRKVHAARHPVLAMGYVLVRTAYWYGLQTGFRYRTG